MTEYYLAANAVISLIGSQRQAALQRAQAAAIEKSGEISLEQAQFEAQQARVQGHEQATYIQRESMRTVGKMVATTGASGAELKGSPIIVMGDQIYHDQMAAATTIANASAHARSIEAAGMAQAATDTASAGVMREQAGITEEGGWLSAIADGLSAYGHYYARTGGPAQTEGVTPWQ